jgi:hypothetical protein
MRLVAALAVLLALATPAHAAVSRKKAIWGPVTVDGRSQFPIYADLGAGIYEYTINWADIAPARPAHPTDPADPGYRWPAELDLAVSEAAKYGIRVSLQVSGAPRWANGGHAARFAPRRPRDYAEFVAAASRRYPAVHLWMIWGEPSRPVNFQPQDPRRYARLLDAAYGALKSVSAKNLVIGGDTFTVGALAWLRGLRLPNGRPPRMDMYGHNPFSARRPDLASPPLPDGDADFSDLDTLAGWVDRYLGRGIKLFLSELTLPTDHANWEFNFHVTRATQASWLAAALRIDRRWPRIYTLGYLGLYDDPARPDGDQVERGLLTRSGAHKPAYAAFKNG